MKTEEDDKIPHHIAEDEDKRFKMDSARNLSSVGGMTPRSPDDEKRKKRNKRRNENKKKKRNSEKKMSEQLENELSPKAF